MSKQRARRRCALVFVVLVFAVASAALVSHVCIDVAGDFFLVRDAYDGLAHNSRSDIGAIAVLIGAGAVLRFFSGAIRDLRSGGPGHVERGHVRFLLARAPWRFAALVVVLTAVALALMEALDLQEVGSPIDDPADLFGGSLPLGLGITAAVATGSAVLTRLLWNLLDASQASLAVALVRLIAPILRAGATLRARAERYDRALAGRSSRSVLARRRGKRGPPDLRVA